MLDYKVLRTGERRRACNGLMMTIVYYERDAAIWIQFSDGSFAEKNSYSNFLKGKIKHPDDTPKMQAVLRLGERRVMRNGQLAIITKYNKATDIEVTFEDGRVIQHCYYRNFALGLIVGIRKRPPTNKERIGETAMMHCGLQCTITDWIHATDMEVTFEGGEVLRHVTYGSFQRRSLYPKQYLRQQKIGEKQLQNCGKVCTIIDFKNYKDVDVEFEDDHTVVCHREYRDFLEGGINPKGSPFWYNGSFNELYCALFFETLGFKKYDAKFYKNLGLGRKEFDLYNLQHNLAIEYDGQRFHTIVQKDVDKDQLAESLNISLYRIREKQCPQYDSKSKKYCVQDPRSENSLKDTLQNVWDDIAAVCCPMLIGCYPNVSSEEVQQKFQTTQTVTQKHIGETIVNNAGHKMTIEAWHNNKNIDISVEGYPNLVRNYVYCSFCRGYQPKEVTKFFSEQSKQQAI